MPRLDLRRRRALLPVVGQVEDRVERVPAEDAPDRGEVGTVGLQVADRRTEIVMVPPVEDRNVVAAGDEPTNDLPPHELDAPDD